MTLFILSQQVNFPITKVGSIPQKVSRMRKSPHGLLVELYTPTRGMPMLLSNIGMSRETDR
jgi:hypothetical protein